MFGAQLAKRGRLSSEPRSIGAFGTPYADQGLGNVYVKIKLAPLLKNAHRETRRGHPIFLYRPDKNLTGTDGTDTAYGLADVNYGLHQRVVYQQLRERGVRDEAMPQEVLRHKEWPATVEEFLSDRMIVPLGIRDQEPNDVRFEGQIDMIPVQIEGLADGIPWIWGRVKVGDKVGFRLGHVDLSGAPIVAPDGSRVVDVADRPVLQLTPMILYSRVPYRGVGDGRNVNYELDFRETLKVVATHRENDEFGLPLGSPRRGDGPPETIEYETRGFGHFFPLGTVGLLRGKPPSEEGVRRALRTYAGMSAIGNTLNRLGIWITPHPRLDRY